METDYTSLHGKATSACSNIERSMYCSKTVQLIVLECSIEINCLVVVYSNIESMNIILRLEIFIRNYSSNNKFILAPYNNNNK